jgi:putative glycosyltransferase (TIGR04348 family)
MRVPSVVIVSPAAAGANNGNERTADRWQAMLGGSPHARVIAQWPDAQPRGDTVMIALHARKSASSIAAWAAAHPGEGLIVVLTGTDLYQDVAVDVDARRSLELAQRLVVLQELGVEELAPPLRAKARVIVQSTEELAAADKPFDHLDVVVVGHLRAVKSPRTVFEIARLLHPSEDIRITHIGDGSGDTALADEARATARECPHYEWIGPVAHGETRERIRRAHLLLHPSLLEGGAHVVMEAVRSHTPVLASHVPGNVGMLGRDYEGYFPHGDAQAAVALLRECRATQNDPAAGKLAMLGAQSQRRAHLFDPANERAALLELLQELEPAR